MKKILALSVALALIGSAVFAEGLTLSGNVKTGLSLTTTENQDGTRFLVESDDVHSGDPTALHMDLNGSYVNEEETAGVNFRLRARAQYSGTDTLEKYTTTGSLTELTFNPSVRGAYGWVKFFDGIVRVDGGRFHDSLWGNSTVNRHIDGQGLEDNLTGARLVISPIEGLSFGWVAGATDAVLKGLSSGDFDSGKWFFANNVVGARYKADFMDVSVAYRMLGSDPDALSLTATGPAPINKFNKAGDELIFDVQVPISALKLDLQGYIKGLGLEDKVETKLTLDGTYTLREGFAVGLGFNGKIATNDAELDGTAGKDVGFDATIVPHILFAVSPSLAFYGEIDYTIKPGKYNTKKTTDHELLIVLRGMIMAGKNATIVIGENIFPVKGYNTFVKDNDFTNQFFVDFIYNF
jgi:hypothetical protein